MAIGAKRAKPTAEQVSTEKRQAIILNKEISESERRFKALVSGRLGRSSLLSGAPASIDSAAGGGIAGGLLGAGSLSSTSSLGSSKSIVSNPGRSRRSNNSQNFTN